MAITDIVLPYKKLDMKVEKTEGLLQRVEQRDEKDFTFTIDLLTPG